MKIYLVRHGQTLFNQQKKVQGWCDSPLTQEGIQQAVAVSKTLQSISFEYAYSSTSERAMDTMHYILQDRSVPHAYVKGLKELNFGSLEGEKEADVFTDISVYEKGFEMYGGETLPTCNQRFMACLETIAKSHVGNVLVVTHGGVIMSVLNYLDEAQFMKHMQEVGDVENCSVTILEYTDHFEILDLADTSYRDRGLLL
ncbi:histidine phosphatase family protein [Eubacterium sp. TM06-47]|nr:histidine phosphatase family protein [Eubacterium sp. TM06-47]